MIASVAVVLVDSREEYCSNQIKYYANTNGEQATTYFADATACRWLLQNQTATQLPPKATTIR